LLEAILARTGAVQRQGSTDAGTTVGDSSKEAPPHKMSVDLPVAATKFMDDSYTFIDCPGSVEFIHDMRAALPAVDAAVVVCGAGEKKNTTLPLSRRRRLRGRRKEDAAVAVDPARARRPQHSALPVPQQDRQGRHQSCRGAAN